MKTQETQFVWHGHRNRKFGLYRPCECGCDRRDGFHGVGYLSGADAAGNGFTIWIEDEDVFQVVNKLLGAIK